MKTRRFLALLLCVILSLGLLPLAVGAETIDTGRDCALTVDFLDNGVPIAGFPFAVYYVASVDAQGTFTAEGDFQKYPVRLNGLSQDQYADLARTAGRLRPAGRPETSEEQADPEYRQRLF